MTLTPAEHKERHVALHRSLDELIADFVTHRGFGSLSTTPIMDLLTWSHEQTLNPTELPA